MYPKKDPIADYLFSKELENQPGGQAPIQPTFRHIASRLGELAAQVHHERIREEGGTRKFNRNLIIKNV